MSASILTFIALSLLAGIATWRKERIVDGHTTRNTSAIRLALSLQFLATAVGAYNIYSAEIESTRLRTAQHSYEATSAAAAHFQPIMDNYFKCLLPGHSELVNFTKLQESFAGMSEATRNSLVNNEPFRLSKSRNQALLECFGKLQSEATSILAESIKFDTQYPNALIQWADITLKLKPENLAEITGDSESAQRYVELMSSGAFGALAAARIFNSQRAQ